MVLFLASELMFFGGLFASYFTLRSQAQVWPPPDVDLDLPLTLVATVMLTASSLTMHLGLVRLRGGRAAAMSVWVLVTFALGAGFLAIKAYEFATAGFGFGSHAYGSLWFTMLGAHGLHLAVGLALLTVLLGRAVRYAEDPGGGEAIGYYWHFVDAVWLALFGTIYLIR
jgi:heme/copper-type cytochrome/quinol oxidase subunit 3